MRSHPNDMKTALATLLLLLMGLLTPALAQTTAVDQTEQKRKLIEQKIRLIDMLVNSPSAKKAAASGDADAAQLVDQGRQSFEAAKQALADNRLDDATRLLDEALKSASSASRKMSPASGSLSDSAQRKTLANMAEQVATYRVSVVELTHDSRVAGQAQQLISRIDALSNESMQLAEGGRLGDANKKMAAAYRLTVEEITKLREGHEVVLSLKFETPLDEYVYEQKRFGSNLTMVDMMISEGHADGQKRKLVDGFVAEGQKLNDQAGVEASSQRHKDAVALMEKASRQLNRALQLMGVPVF